MRAECLTIRIPAEQVLDPDAVGRFRIYLRGIVAKMEGIEQEEE
jgi:hypothetical protein